MAQDTIREKTGCDTMEELVEQTRGPRARLIDAILFHDGVASSRRIREHGQIPSGQYHFNKLEEQGIIERRGTEYESKGGNAVRYGLTRFGADVADALDVEGDPERGSWQEMVQVVNEIAGIVEENKRELERKENKIRALTEQLQTLEREVDALKGDGDDDGDDKSMPAEHDERTR